MLSELPFYEELNVIKTNHAFRGYAMSYKVEIIEKKDPIKQLEASKSSIKDLFSDLLNETKGFKVWNNTKSCVKKYKSNGEIEFAPVYFNSTTKTVINNKFCLEIGFQEILYRIDNWINEWSGRTVESQYINISTHRPLLGSSYVILPAELRSSKKELTNTKHINPVKIHPERRITRKYKQLANDLDYGGIKLSVQEKYFSKIEIKNNICNNVYFYENKLTFPIYISD